MRRSDPGKSSGRNRGVKGENSAESKTCRKKRSASISTPGLASSEFLPVYFVDLASSEGHEELDVHLYSIQRRFSGKKMRDKIQTITTKESSHAEISELPLKPVKFPSESDLQVIKDTNSASLSPLKQLNMPVLSTCFEQDFNLPKHKSTKKSSKRGRDDNADIQILSLTNPGNAVCKKDRNQSLEMASKTEIVSPPKIISKGKRKQNSSDVKLESVSKLVSDIKKDRKHSTDTNEESHREVTKSKFLKTTPEQEKRQFSSYQNDSIVGAVSLAEKQETNVLDKNKWNNEHLSANFTIRMTSPQGKETFISNDTRQNVTDTSTPKTTTKNKNEFFPDVALSPEWSTPKSSRRPLLTSGFVSHTRQKLASSFSPKSLDHSAEAESSFNLSSNKSLLNTSSNSIFPKTNINNSYTSDKSTRSADSLSNLTFSSSSFGNSSFLATPKTPESFNSTETQQWKLRRGMSDIGPRSYKNLAWRDSVHGSSDTLHSSFLNRPPYARLRERLLDNRHLLPRRYSQAPVEKYHSFQHSPYQAKHTDWKSNFLNQCWSLKHNFIDSHCHLDFLFERLPFDGSFQKYYRKNLDTFPCNFAGCVAIFCEPKSFTSEGLWKVLLSDDMVWLAMGCHPKKATGFDAAAEKGLNDCLKHSKVVAVGEIGLDYSGRFIESAEIQKKVFVCQIKIALAVKKPLVIHCRDAQDDCLQILKKYVPSDYRIHCHCFTKSFKLAKEWLAFFPNLYIGLTPLVTYPSAKEVHDTARNLPLERLLLETDAPYFVPKFVPRGMMKFSHPGLAISVAFEVAKLKGTNVETVLQHCLENTKKMYGI